MAIFHHNIIQLARQTMITSTLDTTDGVVGFQCSTKVSLYAGLQPTANDVAANWPSYTSTSTDYLGFIPSALLTEVSTSSFTLAALTTATATGSGTATWAILWNKDISNGSLDTDTLPTSAFWVVPACDITTSTGVAILLDTNLTSGQTFTLADVTLKLGGA
jgi:hypothetical protein